MAGGLDDRTERVQIAPSIRARPRPTSLGCRSPRDTNRGGFLRLAHLAIMGRTDGQHTKWVGWSELNPDVGHNAVARTATNVDLLGAHAGLRSRHPCLGAWQKRRVLGWQPGKAIAILVASPAHKDLIALDVPLARGRHGARVIDDRHWGCGGGRNGRRHGARLQQQEQAIADKCLLATNLDPR